MDQPQTQPDATAARGASSAVKLTPAAEQSQLGEGCPPLSNEDEEKLFGAA